MPVALKTIVLNGWAASPEAWDLCTFRRDAFFSYIDQLDGRPEAYLDSVLAAAPTTRCAIVGWSMGGSSALRLACRYRAHLAGLVLVAATPRMMEEKDTRWRGMSPRRLDALERGLRITKGQGFFGVPEGKPNPYQVDSDENLARGLDYLLRTDLRAELQTAFPNGDVPFAVHLFQSEQDAVVRAENAVWLKTIFPRAHLTCVPGTEHALPIFIPEAIDAALADVTRAAAQVVFR